jgi:hypothetical protein
LFHICPSALIEWMFSIVSVSDPLTPDFIQLHLVIVNSASRGRIEARNRLSGVRTNVA